MPEASNQVATAAAPAAQPSALRRLFSSDFVRKVSETYLTHVLKIGLGLATTVLVARLLGPEGRGYFAVAAAVGALGVQFATLGLHSSNTYFVARDPKLAGALAGNSLVIGLGFGGLLAALLWVFFSLEPGLISLSGFLVVVAVVFIPFGLCYNLLSNLLLGVHDVRGYNLAEFTNRFVPVPLLLLLLIVHRPDITLALATTILAVILAAVLVFTRLLPRLGSALSTSRALFRSNLDYGAKAYLASLFAFLVLRSDLFLVEHIRGAAEAGYYSIAANMADAISLLAYSVGTILFPKVSAITDIQQKLRLTIKATKGTGVMMAPMLVIACLLAKPAVLVLFGRPFLPAVAAFILLAPGMFFLCIHAVSVQFLNSIGYPKAVVVIWGGCTALNIGLNLWAVPRWGMLGASIVSSISYALAAVMVLAIIPYYARRAERGERIA